MKKFDKDEFQSYFGFQTIDEFLKKVESGQKLMSDFDKEFMNIFSESYDSKRKLYLEN